MTGRGGQNEVEFAADYPGCEDQPIQDVNIRGIRKS
jgi:hypothetical protein